MNLLREKHGRLKAEVNRTEHAGLRGRVKADAGLLQQVISRLEIDAAS